MSARLPSESALESEATELPAVASLAQQVIALGDRLRQRRRLTLQTGSAASAEAMEPLVLSMAAFMSPIESRTSPNVSEASDTEPANES